MSTKKQDYATGHSASHLWQRYCNENSQRTYNEITTEHHAKVKLGTLTLDDIDAYVCFHANHLSHVGDRSPTINSLIWATALSKASIIAASKRLKIRT